MRANGPIAEALGKPKRMWINPLSTAKNPHLKNNAERLFSVETAFIHEPSLDLMGELRGRLTSLEKKLKESGFAVACWCHRQQWKNVFVFWTPHRLDGPPSARRADAPGYAVIDLTRAVRRETLREAVFLGTMPFWAERISMGSASLRACSAVTLLPDAIASSTVRTPDFRRVRRLLLTSSRRNETRAARFAELVLAMVFPF